jgi:hypothetical protein
MDAHEVPPIALEQWRPLVALLAKEWQLVPNWILAQIWTECEEDIRNPRLTRREPYYQYFYDLTQGPLYDKQLSAQQNRKRAFDVLGGDEFEFQTTSHGLMQLMGATARDMGFIRDRADIYDPATNINLGCKYLKQCFRRARGDHREALRYYNGGYRYANRILQRIDALKKKEGG